MGQDLAADRKVVGIHSELDSETVVVVSAELFVTVAEIVVVVDVVIDVRAVDGVSDELAGETADVGRAVADGVTGVVAVDAGGATSDGVFDVRDNLRGPAAPEGHSFHPATSAVDHYSAGTFASRRTVCSSADCSERKCCRRSRRRC